MNDLLFQIDDIKYKAAQNSVSNIFYIIQLTDNNKCYKSIGKIQWNGRSMQELKSKTKELLETH